jgi:HlyD family secretion protein
MRVVSWMTATLALIGSGAGAWYIYGGNHSASLYRTVTVERGDLMAVINATGTIEPEEVIDVGAQVAGLVREFGRDPQDPAKSIDFCTEVNQDTVLARLDDSLYVAQVEQAKANVQKAEADLLQLQARLQQTEREWNRVRRLGPSRGVISELDYDLALANFESAKASLTVGDSVVAQSKAALRQAEINLSYTVIRSPVKGVIVARRVNVGQTVVASLNAPSLFLIAKDLRRLQVWAAVNEADIGSIHVGQKVRFTVDAFPDRLFLGTVGQIRLDAQMTQNVVTYTVVVHTDNSDGKLLPYLTGNLQFEVSQRHHVVLIPNGGLRWRPSVDRIHPDEREAYLRSLRQPPRRNLAQGGSPKQQQGTVWLADGRYVRPVKVNVGLTDGTMTEVTSDNLPEGAEVVIGANTAEEEEVSSPFAPQMFKTSKNKQ